MVALAVWALWPAGRDERAAEGSSEQGSPDQPVARVEGRPAQRVSSVSGVVRRSGQAVANAHVVLKGAQMFTTESGADGTFEFASVLPGGLYLSASVADAASDVLGPLELEPGARLSNLVLELTPSVVVNGVVIDFVNRAPISKAVIVSAAGAVVTDAAGGFALKGPMSQTWVDVSAPGYLSRSEWVALELARTGSRLEVVLMPASHIEGTVTVGGAVARDATVFVELSRGARRGERSGAVQTNEKGHFDLQCADGRLVVVAVTKEGAQLRSAELMIAIGERRTGVVLEANELDSIGGVVTRDGQPLGNASVTVINARSNDVVAAAITVPGGQFRTQPVVTGNYVVQVRSGAFVGVAGPFEHRLGGAPWTIAVSGGAKLSGRVEPAAAGIRVRWRSGDWAGPAAETVTDAAGAFAFEGVSAGLLSVDAEGAGGAATTTAHAGDEVVLQLTHGFVIAHLQDDSGAVLTDGMLFAKSLETGVVRRFLVLAPDGTYRFELPTGRWELQLEVAGRGKSGAAKVEVTTAGVDVRLSLEAGVVVRGVVRDAVTKLPISGAMIRVRAPDLQSETASVLTNARGEYVTPPIPKTHGITASAAGFRERGDAVSNLNMGNAVFELTPAPANDVPPQPQPPFEGIGMTIDMSSGRPTAASLVEASPAERAGVLRGDVIVSVDGVPAGADMNALVGRIRGPAGTPVQIVFERGGRPFELVIRRRQISPM